MTLLLVIIAILVLLLVYLLWLPILLNIDTEMNQYHIRLKGLALLNVEGDAKEIIRLNLKVFFMKFTFYPLRRKKKAEAKKLPSVEKKKNGKCVAVKKILRIVRTFEVKKIVIDMDTGDYVMNAKLFPVFMLLNSTKGSFRINFVDRNRLVLQIKNRPIRILKSFINL